MKVLTLTINQFNTFVKNILDAHEGNIRVKSIRDQGTEIIVEFPIRYQNKEIL